MLIVIHNLVDPNDKLGRTYKEVNLAKEHHFRLNSLVELTSKTDKGVRLVIARYARDCDGTPLYDLSPSFCDCVEQSEFLTGKEYHEAKAKWPEAFRESRNEQDEAGHFYHCDHRLSNRVGCLVNYGQDNLKMVRKPPYPSIAEK